MPTKLLASMICLFGLSGCSYELFYEQVPAAYRQSVLGMEIRIAYCNSHLFIPRVKDGPEAICIASYADDPDQQFKIDLAYSTIQLNDDPLQALVEINPADGKAANSQWMNASVQANHLAGYNPVHNSSPKQFILFPLNNIKNRGDLIEAIPYGESEVSVDLLFTHAGQTQRVVERFNVQSYRRVISIFDLGS